MTQIISQAMTTRVVKCHNWQWRRRDDDLRHVFQASSAVFVKAVFGCQNDTIPKEKWFGFVLK